MVECDPDGLQRKIWKMPVVEELDLAGATASGGDGDTSADSPDGDGTVS